jgi:hypothetical protein
VSLWVCSQWGAAGGQGDVWGILAGHHAGHMAVGRGKLRERREMSDGRAIGKALKLLHQRAVQLSRYKGQLCSLQSHILSSCRRRPQQSRHVEKTKGVAVASISMHLALIINRECHDLKHAAKRKTCLNGSAGNGPARGFSAVPPAVFAIFAKSSAGGPLLVFLDFILRHTPALIENLLLRLILIRTSKIPRLPISAEPGYPRHAARRAAVLAG